MPIEEQVFSPASMPAVRYVPKTATCTFKLPVSPSNRPDRGPITRDNLQTQSANSTGIQQQNEKSSSADPALIQPLPLCPAECKSFPPPWGIPPRPRNESVCFEFGIE